MGNPYKGEKGKIWAEGYDAKKWEDFDTIIAMNKARKDALKILEEQGIWYDRVIAGKVKNGRDSG